MRRRWMLLGLVLILASAAGFTAYMGSQREIERWYWCGMPDQLTWWESVQERSHQLIGWPSSPLQPAHLTPVRIHGGVGP